MPWSGACSGGIWWGEACATGRRNRCPQFSCAGPPAGSYKSTVKGPPQTDSGRGELLPTWKRLGPTPLTVLKGAVAPASWGGASHGGGSAQRPGTHLHGDGGRWKPTKRGMYEGNGSSPPRPLCSKAPQRRRQSSCSPLLPFLCRSSEPGWGCELAWSEF